MAKSLIGKIMDVARIANAAPIPFNSRWNVSGNQLYGSGTQDRQTQIQMMGALGTLYAIVQLLSWGAASPEWHLYRKTRDGRVRYTTSDRGSDMRVEVLSHQALKLWHKPNDFMNGQLYREIGWQFMELVGEWYWVLDRGPNGTAPPMEMWPVRPDRMEPIPDKNKFLVGWLYTGPNGEQVPLRNEEVIQVRYPNPMDIYRGMSPVQSLLADLDSSRFSAEWSRNFFLNSATPGGIVQFSKRLTDEEFEEFTIRWREQHQGVARGHRVGVLEQGAQWIPNTYTIKEMQFIELRTMNREIIREAYRIHASLLGIAEDVNRANAETAEEVHVAWHEVPRLKRQRSVLNNIYLPMFYGGNVPDVEFDFEDPTPTSPTESNAELTAKANAAAALVKAGYDSADVCDVVGLPHMGWAPPPVPAPALRPGPAPHTVPFEPAEATTAASMIRQAVREMGASDDEYALFARVMQAELPPRLRNGNGNRELV